MVMENHQTAQEIAQALTMSIDLLKTENGISDCLVILEYYRMFSSSFS